MYQKDQHLARKIECDKEVGHILYRAMMHGQRLWGDSEQHKRNDQFRLVNFD